MGKSNLFEKVIIGTFLGVPLFIYGSIVYEVTIGVRNRFEEAYQTALLRYADTNQNGVLGSEEKEAFDAGWLQDR